MKNILTMSRREITRLRSRFSGKSRIIVLAILALTIVCSYVIYHQDLVISKGLYNVGVSADAPLIADSRFNVTEFDRDTGYDLLEQGTIDLFLDGNSIFSNYSERSEYAAGALQKYLEKQELLRVAEEYEIDRAFPLRVEVGYLDTEDEGPVEESETPVIDTAEAPAVAIADEETPVSPSSAGSVIEVTPLEENIAAASAVALPESLPAAPGATDDAVRQQLAEFAENKQLPEFKAEFISENDIIIPSLMNPPIPLAQVIITFLYVVPVFFISLFFTSSFTEEKVSRKLIVLLSAPVTRLQVIMGKMLPYLAYSIIVIIGVTMVLKGNILLGLAIFVPVMLFIFSIYLMVALTYRTFKDQTFFSVLALSVVTVYLVGPAMFTGVNDLSYISPLTLAVTMYRGETFTVSQYFLATTPLLLVFGQTMFVGTRVFNEEYLMGFRPLHSKIAEAIYLTLDKAHLSLSTLFMGMSLVPLVFMVELASIVFVTNLPMPFMLGFMLIVSVVVEELAKSAGVVILLQNNALRRKRDVLKLAVLSALGFMLAEKLLLLMAMSVVSDSSFIQVMFGGGLLLLPLALHVVSTSVVCLFTSHFGTRYYLLAIVLGSIIHAIYNVSVMGAVL
jgi:ABC-type Na+ efflux pump permease subunit